MFFVGPCDKSRGVEGWRGMVILFLLLHITFGGEHGGNVRGVGLSDKARKVPSLLRSSPSLARRRRFFQDARGRLRSAAAFEKASPSHFPPRSPPTCSCCCPSRITSHIFSLVEGVILPLASRKEHGHGDRGTGTTTFSGRRGILGAASVLVVLVATALVATVQRARAGASTASFRAPSLASRVGPWSTKMRTGCSNWDQVYIASGIYDSEHACGNACSRFPGCKSFNYQPQNCSNQGPNTGTLRKTCVFQSGDCDEVFNACWDLHIMDSPKEAPFCLSSTRTGCSNWKDALISRHANVSNVHACAMKCTALGDQCRYFSFMPGPGHCEVDPGTCLLLNGGCNTEEDNCFDYYEAKPCSTLAIV
ncbi:unnamed protein product [Prorocentrum cordatum]|uniref:Apple domain-containing protein n=1 Tax=Prorocentrum cordatum TaxID=2364126 RepID=A0ABN9T655_9DINO|nr:unnamed protein product [Polarella glacialis]